MIDLPCGCGNPLEELCGEDCDGWAVDVELEKELAWFRSVCSILPVGARLVYINEVDKAAKHNRGGQGEVIR